MFSQLIGRLSAVWYAVFGPPTQSVELAGVVTKKRTRTQESYTDTLGWTNYYITVSRTEFEVPVGRYHWFDVGHEVVLTIMLPGGVDDVVGAGWRHVVAITDGPSSTAHQLSVLEHEHAQRLSAQRDKLYWQEAQENHRRSEVIAQARCTALRDLGIDATVLEGAPNVEAAPDALHGWDSWIEVADGPIRWVGITAALHSIYWIPDPRISRTGREVALQAIGVRSFPLWGRRTIRWEVDPWSFGMLPDNDPHSLRIADSLSQDTAATEAMLQNGISLGIETNLERGCWMLTSDNKLTRPLWDTWGAIARVLLATPMPPEGSS